MEATTDTPGSAEPSWTPVMGAAVPVDDLDVQRLAETFAATPEAVRLAVERVGPDFRDLQRELGGRR